MCIIMYKPVGKKMIGEKMIRRLFKNNPDGAGLMYPLNGRVHIQKGFMDVESLLAFINKINESDWLEAVPVVLHCRIGTAGLKDELNCHPYPVGMPNFVAGECDLAMAHNGVLYGYTPKIGSKINDTQVFVNDVLDKLSPGFIKNADCVKLIEELSSPSRLCFMDGNGNVAMTGKWYEDDGLFYSNDGYKERSIWTMPIYSTGKKTTTKTSGKSTSSWYPLSSASHYKQESLFSSNKKTAERDIFDDCFNMAPTESDGLSFGSKFFNLDDDIEVYYPESVKAYSDALSELNDKFIEDSDYDADGMPLCVGYYSSKFYYEVDQFEDCIYRYQL